MDRFANSLMGGVIAVAVISIVLTVLIIMYRRDKSIYVKIETLKEKKEKTIETKQEDDWCIRIIDVILSLIALIVLFPIFFYYDNCNKNIIRRVGFRENSYSRKT